MVWWTDTRRNLFAQAAEKALKSAGKMGESPESHFKEYYF